jgi:hypothetical protein
VLTPISRGVEKYFASVMLERTYAHSTMLGSPFNARHRANVKRAPAYAMDSVAEPAPALAFTTSVPASCLMEQLVSTMGKGMKPLKERPWTGTPRGKEGKGDLSRHGEDRSTMRH